MADRVVTIRKALPPRCCKTCNHWFPLDTPKGQTVQPGECRPYSPTLGEDGWGQWPKTFENDRCGEWEALSDAV